MPLADILYPDPTSRGMDVWSFANYQHHQLVIGALQRQKQITQPLFRIWPIAQNNFNDWLEQHQEQHNLTNSALGTSGFDLSSVDPTNKKQFDAFVWIHFIEHRNWAQSLGLGI